MTNEDKELDVTNNEEFEKVITELYGAGYLQAVRYAQGKSEEICVQQRPWGYWTVLQHFPGKAKVKTLTIKPDQQLSIQRHFKRNETWFKISGEGKVYMQGSWYTLYDITYINIETWHSIMNTGVEDLLILEVQWGGDCEESDIERQ